jgi:hypothetical protein
VGTSKRQAKAGRCSLLVVVKGEHRYLVKYNPERKSELFDTLLDYGMDDGYNLTTFDALALIERLEGNNSGASVISLGEGESVVEKDLTFERPGSGAPGFETDPDF